MSIHKRNSSLLDKRAASLFKVEDSLLMQGTQDMQNDYFSPNQTITVGSMGLKAHHKQPGIVIRQVRGKGVYVRGIDDQPLRLPAGVSF